MLEDPPKLRLKLSAADYGLEVAACIALVFLWAFSLFYFPDLPGQIPMHYNAAGEVDSYGPKETIFGLPAFATLLIIALTWLNRYPHRFNYVNPVTVRNAEQHYRIATRMIRVFKICIVVIFGLIDYQTVLIALGGENTFGHLFVVFTIALILIPLIYFMWRMSEIK